MDRWTRVVLPLCTLALVACGGGVEEGDRQGDGAGGGGGSSLPATVADFSCSPSVLEFGRVFAGLEKTLAVECRNLSEVEGVLEVAPVVAAEGGAFLHRYTADGGQVRVPAGAMQRIEVVFLARDGEASGFLEIGWASEDPDVFRTHEVSLTGLAVTHGVRCHGDFDFGTVPVGSSAKRVLTCLNEAPMPLRITELALDLSSDAVFRFAPSAPVEVPAAGEEPGLVELEVGFTPPEAGRRFNGILNLHTDDPTTPLMQFGMTGVGAEP